MSASVTELLSKTAHRFTEQQQMIKSKSSLLPIVFCVSASLNDILLLAKRRRNHKMFIGLAFSRIAHSLRSDHCNIELLDKEQKEELAFLIHQASRLYLIAINKLKLCSQSLPMLLAESSVACLMDCLEAAQNSNDDFTEGFFSGLLALKAHQLGRLAL